MHDGVGGRESRGELVVVRDDDVDAAFFGAGDRGDGRAATVDGDQQLGAVVDESFNRVEIEAVGTAQAKEAVQITSKVSNTVTAIRFKEGEEVSEGAVLVEMYDAEARAAVAEAEAALARSRSQFDRSRDLQSRQALSVADLEQVEADLKADEARVAAARARLDDTVIRAAFHGRTGFRHVSVGSFVSPGTLITTLDDTSIIKLDFTVPETYLFVLRRGLPVKAAATGLPDRTFTGVITNMDSRVDPVTRSVTVRAEPAVCSAIFATRCALVAIWREVARISLMVVVISVMAVDCSRELVACWLAAAWSSADELCT